MQVYICVVCKENRPPLFSLSVAHRQIFEATVAPYLDITELKKCHLLSCGDCQQLIQAVLSFQETALAGAQHLLQLLPIVLAKQIPDPLEAHIKDELKEDSMLETEPEENSLLEVKSFMEIEIEAEKIQTKPVTAADTAVKNEPGEDLEASDPALSVKTEAALVGNEQTDAQQVTTALQMNESMSATLAQQTPPLVPRWRRMGAATISDATLATLLQSTAKLPRLLPKQSPATTSTATTYTLASAEQTDTQKLAILMQSTAKLPRLLPKQFQASTAAATAVPPADTGQTHTESDGKISRSKFYSAPPRPDAPFYTRVLTDEEVESERAARRASAEYAAAAFRCQPCVTVFPTADAMHAHLELHLMSAGAYACHICNQRVHSMQELSKHRSQHTVRYCCCYCPHSAPDRRTATRHACAASRQHWPEAPAAPARPRYRYPRRELKCPHCFAAFADAAAVARHTAKHHSEPPEPAECEVCNKVFKSKYLLKRHSYSHKRMGLERLRAELFCAECKLAFPTPSAFRAHNQTLKHSSREQWKFECDICGQKCPNKSGLRIHIQIVHTEIRDFKCDRCPKSFVSRNRLQRHARAHEPDAQPRPHVCHQCGKAFKMKKTLSEHLNMHAGIRPHACPLCPATFTFKAALYTHNQLKHLKIKRKWDKKKGKKAKVDGARETPAEEK